MRAVIAAALLLLAGCAETIAESRVRSALLDAGLSERNADCMAERMVDRLTIAQLRRLEALEELEGKEPTLPEFVRAVREIDDPEILGVTASSAALCATGLAR